MLYCYSRIITKKDIKIFFSYFRRVAIIELLNTMSEYDIVSIFN